MGDVHDLPSHCGVGIDGSRYGRREVDIPRYTLPQYRRRRLVRDFLEGVPRAELGHRYGISRQHAYRVIEQDLDPEMAKDKYEEALQELNFRRQILLETLGGPVD